MENYQAPKIEIVTFETLDIIQTSGEATPQILNAKGIDLGTANATNIFE